MAEGLKLVEKLQKIQFELKAPKNQRNNFGKYNYRSCEDILESVKPLLDKYGCFIKIYDEIEQVGERYYVKATAVLGDVNNTDGIKVQAYAREEESKKGMDSSQVTGSSSSYARKYALNGLFAIDDTKDSDFTGKASTENKGRKKIDRSLQIKKEIADILKIKDIKYEAITATIKEKFNKNKYDDLTSQEQEKLLEEVGRW